MSEEEEEKYVQCQNCRQNILESKMFLHEGFCLRNNKYCPECEKVFLATEFEEHLKTHLPKPSPKQPSQAPPLPEKKEITNQSKQPSTALTEHRKKCDHKEPVPHITHHKKKKKEKKEDSPPVERPKIKAVIVDDNLGLKLCEYCCNMVENLEEHLEKCEVKKMIEIEGEKYYKDLEKRNKEDNILANKLSKIKEMDVSNDEKMARDLQGKLKPLIDTSNDEKMAKDLQKKLKPFVDTSKDKKMAKDLEKELKPLIDTSNDERMARDLQKKFGGMNLNTSKDEEIARRLQKEMEEERKRNNERRGEDFEGMDDELRRAIEESKKYQ